MKREGKNVQGIPKMLGVFWGLSLACCVGASTLATPPQSAIIVAFEDTYDLSLLANTLSDQGIDSTLIVQQTETKIYEHLIEVEILRLNESVSGAENSDARALDSCRILINDENILRKIDEIQPTFTIFPALRYDGCLLPWSKFIDSIPIIWARGINEELYAFDQTRVALPVSNGGFISNLFLNLNLRMTSNSARNNYVKPALRLIAQRFPKLNVDLETLYSSVNVVLWGADSILRTSAASLSQLFVEVGCHHCRAPQPLQSTLQKQLIEHKYGIVLVLLDKSYSGMIKELAQKLPQGREGQGVLWRVKGVDIDEKPENLFISGDEDRQNLIGFSRTRVLLSHCSDTEFLESAFHGVPILCFPRNSEETRNTLRGVELGFSLSMQNEYSGNAVANAALLIQQESEYRERARKVSVAIRDRLEPGIDRLIHWLRYAARIKGEGPSLLAPPISVGTYAEAFQWIFGFFAGTLFSILLTVVYFFVRYIIEREKPVKSKGKYKR